MKNQTRRFSREEYRLLLDALRTHEHYLERAETTKLPPAPVALEKLFGEGLRAKVVEILAKDKSATHVLRERVQELFQHDINWLGPDEPTWCLGCRRRHEPHCSQCPGCLPDNLLE